MRIEEKAAAAAKLGVAASGSVGRRKVYGGLVPAAAAAMAAGAVMAPSVQHLVEVYATFETGRAALAAAGEDAGVEVRRGPKDQLLSRSNLGAALSPVPEAGSYGAAAAADGEQRQELYVSAMADGLPVAFGNYGQFIGSGEAALALGYTEGYGGQRAAAAAASAEAQAEREREYHALQAMLGTSDVLTRDGAKALQSR